MEVYAILWNGALTIGVAIMIFLMNRVASTLDGLQRADKEMSKEFNEFRTSAITRPEVSNLMERMESRLEAYQSMHIETSKVIFAKLDLISDKISTKIDRQECLQMMNDRRGRPWDSNQ